MAGGNVGVAHAILFPFQAQGHTLPALMVAERLLECDIQVTFVTFKDRLDRIHEALMLFGDDKFRQQLKVVALEIQTENSSSRGHDKQGDLALMIQQCFESKPAFEKLLDQLITSGCRCCILSDNVISWTQDSANRFGIPRYLLYPSPASILAGVFHIKQMNSEGILPLRSSSSAFVEIPGMAPVRTADMHSYLLDNMSKEARNFYVGCCCRVHEAAGVLVNTFQDLEAEPLDALRNNRLLNPNKVPVFPVGPLFSKTHLQRGVTTSKEEPWFKWLSSKPKKSVLYVSFGSIHEVSAQQAKELALGLEATGINFLWILRGVHLLPPGFQSRTSGRAMVVNDWLPQPQVLSHSSIAGFLTHGGWNSVLESICLGVPMLLMPAFSDQTLNTRTVEKLQVGFELKKDQSDLITRDEVKARVNTLIAMDLGRSSSLVNKAADAWSCAAPEQVRAFVRGLC